MNSDTRFLKKVRKIHPKMKVLFQIGNRLSTPETCLLVVLESAIKIWWCQTNIGYYPPENKRPPLELFELNNQRMPKVVSMNIVRQKMEEFISSLLFILTHDVFTRSAVVRRFLARSTLREIAPACARRLVT